MAAESNTSDTPVEEQPSTSDLAAPSGSSSSEVVVDNKEVPKDKGEVLQLALNFLGQGKRALLVKDIAAATTALGESCQLLTEVNGPLCPDNAEAHFYYGKALLEQSRLELDVIEGGPAAEKEDSSNEEEDNESGVEEDNEESEEAVQKEDEENEAEAEPQSPEEKEPNSTTTEDDVDEKKEEDLSSPSPAAAAVQDSEKPSTSAGPSNVVTNGENAEKEGEEELSNLELAWEVLEVAKIGYSNQLVIVKTQLEEAKEDEVKDRLSKTKKHLLKRLSETHSLLGEVATESENYPQAVEDFKTGIKILSEIESPDSREIAQYYFQMGLAFTFGKSFQEAIASYEKSKEMIQARINILTSKIENKQTAKDLGIELEDPSYTEDVEIAELKAVIPELDEKISDTIDAEQENKNALEEEVKEQEIALKNSPVKNPNPPIVNDISHLVKKKKKAEDVPPEAPPAKRVCNEPDVSSPILAKEEVTSSNGHSNGSVS